MFMVKRLKEFTPHPGLVFNVHLDGMEKNHDLAVERAGVFKEAIEGIKAAKAAGFKVFTNTTVYKETDMNEIWELYEFLEPLKVDGHAISPAYGYSAVNRPRNLHDARRCPREVQGHRQVRQALPAGVVAGVHGISARAIANCRARRGACRPTTSRAGKARAT